MKMCELPRGMGQDNESTWDGLRPRSFVDTCVKATIGQQGFYGL